MYSCWNPARLRAREPEVGLLEPESLENKISFISSSSGKKIIFQPTLGRDRLGLGKYLENISSETESGLENRIFYFPDDDDDETESVSSS